MKTHVTRLLSLTVAVFSGFIYYSQTTAAFSASGNFTVPCNVTSITVEVWGGGGGGAGGGCSGIGCTSAASGGGGGGGGGYSTRTYAVTPGQVIAYTVGNGGAGGGGGNPASNGAAGTASTFSGPGFTITGNGGAGGIQNGAGGAGGTGVNGTTNTTGTTGATRVAGAGGAGGAGGDGGGPGGGAGGAANAGVGAVPGGGGGGKTGVILGAAGGVGGRGEVRVTYTPTTAGVDQNLAACAPSATMAATAPAAGTGTWSCVANCGGVSITTPTSATSTVTGLTAGVDPTLRWTVSNAGCTSTTDDVIINTTSAAIDAGPAQNLAACATTGTLAGVAIPNGGTGTWTCITNCGGVSIASPNSPTSTFSGLTVPNATTFRWSGCNTTDDVIINTVSGPMCPVYCGQAAQNCASFTEGITNVTFKTINSTSTVCAENGGTAVVTPGSSFPISVTGQGAGNYQGGVWCDWNADGDFNDAGEYTSLGAMSPGVAKTGTISVPATAVCDATIKMRVVYTYGTLNSGEACTESDYGEAEDYSLLISCCTPNCANGVQDCNELGVDCGGPCGSPCAGVPSCTNSIQDQDETGVDCGGLICAPCGVPCSTFSGATATPVEVSNGGIVDATGGNQTITTCVNVTYSNRGTNWLHGVFINPASTGFVSSSGVGAVPEPNYGTLTGTYFWRPLSNNFTGNTSGNSLTQDGWYVVTGAADANPGDNLGWPDGAGTTFGPFCFETVVSCDGLDGDVNAFMNFQTTGDSYSGSWTTIDCGKETSFGDNSFSYTLRCPSALPVEMLDFRAQFVGRMVKVSWSTLSEYNTDYFEVYKSNDGTFFEKMETVQAAGHSSFQRDYASYDVNPSDKITYYKIKQYDINGTKSETKTIGLLTPLHAQDISVVPNPVSSVSSITFNSDKKEFNRVSVVDVSGKILLQEEIEVNEGANVYTFNTDDLNEGIYFLELSNQTENKKVKFVKSKN